MWLKFLNSRNYKLKGQALILYKIALDRLLYSPAFNILQMSLVYKVGGQAWPQVFESLKRTFWTAQILNWKMWCVGHVHVLVSLSASRSALAPWWTSPLLT